MDDVKRLTTLCWYSALRCDWICICAMRTMCTQGPRHWRLSLWNILFRNMLSIGFNATEPDLKQTALSAIVNYLCIQTKCSTFRVECFLCSIWNLWRNLQEWNSSSFNCKYNYHVIRSLFSDVNYSMRHMTNKICKCILCSCTHTWLRYAYCRFYLHKFVLKTVYIYMHFMQNGFDANIHDSIHK